MSALRNLALDGATGRIRFGAKAVPLTKITLPDEEVKTEKIRYIGEQIAGVQTLGIIEVGSLEAEMTSAVFVSTILPLWAEHGNNIPEFPITVTQRHPLVAGPYSIVCDRCRFQKLSESIEASEKANVVKLMFSVIEVYRRGADGVWKSLAYKSALGPSAAALALF